MGKDEFERDLDEYLGARKRARLDVKKFIKRFIPKPKPKVELHEKVEVYEEEGKPKREGIKKKILDKLLIKQEPPSEELLRAKMQAEDAVADMREVAKIALKMIKELPDDHLRKFKDSPDFADLKNLLKKHELIK
jgi:hypothetical protein